MEKKIKLNLTNNDDIIYHNIHPSFKQPYVVFDSITDSSKGSLVLNRGNNYIGYNFNKYINLSKYIIYPWFFQGGSQYVNCPTGWILQASNDNINWVDIQTIQNLPVDWNGPKEFKLEKISRYKMFRLYNVVAQGYPGFFEIEFYDSDIRKILIKQDDKYYSLNYSYDNDTNRYNPLNTNQFNSDICKEYGFQDIKGLLQKIKIGYSYTENIGLFNDKFKILIYQYKEE